MKQFICRHNELRELLYLVSLVIKMPICFYDPDGNCISCSHGLPSADYCTSRRQNPVFMKACERCDIKHIEQSRKIGLPLVYHCHAGLYDCAIPFFDPQGCFLGGFIVGQQRDPKASPPGNLSRKDLLHYQKIEPVTPEQLMNVATLLKKLTEYIVLKDLLVYRKLPWVEAVDLYFRNNCTRNITISELADVTGYSVSFLTHRFSDEFQMSFKKYQRKLRMEYAMNLLLQEQQVKTTAEKAGYSNQFLFSTLFKSYFGHSPSHYLRKKKNRIFSEDISAE